MPDFLRNGEALAEDVNCFLYSFSVVLPCFRSIRDTSECGFSTAEVSPGSGPSLAWLLHRSWLAPVSCAGCCGLTGFQERGHIAQQDACGGAALCLTRRCCQGLELQE